MIIRSSMLSEMKGCFRKCYYKYTLGLIPSKSKPNVDLLFGKVVHKAIQILHTEGKDAADDFLSVVRFPVSTNKKNRATAKILFNSYAMSPMNIVAVEKPFSFSIGKHTWKGRFDGIIEVRNALYVADHKTTQAYFLLSKPNDQFISYWKGAKINGYDVQGVVLNHLDPVNFTCSRKLIGFTEKEFRVWREETKVYLSTYQRCLTTEVVPKNPSHCLSYGKKCPYFILCTADEATCEVVKKKFYKINRNTLNY